MSTSSKTDTPPAGRLRILLHLAVGVPAWWLAYRNLAAFSAWAMHPAPRKLETPLHPLRESDAEATTPTVDFHRGVMPIFELSCIDCHGPKKQRAKFRVDRREDFFATGDPKLLIVPGHWEKSGLRDIVTGQVKDMKSAEEHLLPALEIELLKAWINAGAIWEDKQPTTSLSQQTCALIPWNTSKSMTRPCAVPPASSPPISHPSAPTQGRFDEPPGKSKFLAATTHML